MKRVEAESLLKDAAASNPGPWVDHSRFAATAAERISRATGAMDEDRSYVSGLLHDIGRYRGRFQNRHLIDGYRYLSERGHAEIAKVCITHAFPVRHIEAAFGSWDCTDEEMAFIGDFISSTLFDEYDRLVQLCDFLASPNGFVIIEKRMVEVFLRYGPNQYTVEKWKAAFELKHEFDRRTGTNTYQLLDGIAENSLQ